MLQLNSSVAVTYTDYGAALLDTRRGRYWSLNDTGALVLQVITAGGDAQDAVDALRHRYDVDRVACEDDVRRVIDELRAHNLLVASTA